MTIRRMRPAGLLVDFWSNLQAVSISNPLAQPLIVARAAADAAIAPEPCKTGMIAFKTSSFDL
jgi:hypothetical protein